MTTAASLSSLFQGERLAKNSEERIWLLGAGQRDLAVDDEERHAFHSMLHYGTVLNRSFTVE